MSKTYIVSEELLRQVLDALELPRMAAIERHKAGRTLRTLLAKEPSEPVGTVCDLVDECVIPTLQHMGLTLNTWLYRKDA